MTTKRDQIILATRDLIFEQGLQDVSMPQIAQRAQVGMGTIYNYFASKEELVFYLYNEIKTSMSAYVLDGYDESQPIVVRFMHILKSVVSYGIHHPRDFYLVEQLAQVPFVLEQSKPDEYALTATFEHWLADAQQQQLLKDIPVDIMSLFIFGAMNTLIEAHAKHQIHLDDGTIKQTLSACWDAIKR